jgi:serine/threonine protein kinase
MTWEPPSEFEEYQIVRQLGAGAMGQVYLAHDLLLDRPVAIKFIGGVEVGAAARRRFFTEARAVARLSHANVVAIYRVGEIRQRPYLVSEYVRGESLAMINKPMPWERALRIGLGLARGLGAAHRSGVLHRDIKPANVMLGDDDEAKLLDFGLAKLVGSTMAHSSSPSCGRVMLALAAGRALDATVSLADRTASIRTATGEVGAPTTLTFNGAVIGTPLYLAPEMWRGAPASRQTDLYALGVVLYELLVGHAPHAGVPLADLADRVDADDAVPIATQVANLPVRLAEAIDSCLQRDPAARPASGDALCELLEAAIPQASITGSPYRGLSRFESEHCAVFFGRAEEARAVVERLRTETFVVVAGDSGVGKSSLCRAAVLPAFVEKSLAGRRWQIAAMVPGTRPLAHLEAMLTQHAGEGLLLFIDQLEELLTIADTVEAAAVAERLAGLVETSSNVRVLATARSDFLGRLPGCRASVSWSGVLSTCSDRSATAGCATPLLARHALWVIDSRTPRSSISWWSQVVAICHSSSSRSLRCGTRAMTRRGSFRPTRWRESAAWRGRSRGAPIR